MKRKAMAWMLPALMVALSVMGFGAPSSAQDEAAAATISTTAVGPQYDTTHVYVTPGAVDAFVASWEATFGGTHTAKVVTTVTPTPSKTESELVFSPVGTLSVFDFQTPVPYPFGAERTGWLMSDFDRGVRLARESGAHLVVAPFDDPIGRDAIVQFPGGINAQLYWHTKAPSYPPLETVPDNRVYLTRDSADEFLSSYLRFTGDGSSPTSVRRTAPTSVCPRRRIAVSPSAPRSATQSSASPTATFPTRSGGRPPATR
ncbi:hypothetical protein SAZ11_03970 [Streptomyces sp. FXJ1.4098]|nr:hypothetical protein [Streptomyces sp. FXJ1.4098]